MNCLKDKKWRLNNLYKVYDKSGELVTFRLNIYQEFLLEKFLRAKKSRTKYKLLILKARQLGITTFNLLYNLDEAIWNSGFRYALIAQGDKEMQEMFDKVKTAWEHFKFKRYFSLMSDTSGRMKFANGSNLRIALSARGDTLQSLTVSELARIGKAYPQREKEIKSGAFNAVSDKTGITVIESTGEGTSGLFYEMAMKAMKGENGYDFCFFPWWANPEYEIDSDEPVEFLPITLQQRELVLQEYNVRISDKKLRWWQDKYADQGDDTLQEFPSIPRQAFLSTGRPFYNADILDKITVKQGFIDEKYTALTWYLPEKYKDIDYRISYLEDQWNLLIGIDFAEGLENGDYTVLRMRNREGKLLASYRAHIEPDEMCAVLNYLYSWGIGATIAPERNNHGHAFLSSAKSQSWYGDIYMDKNIDTVSEKPKNKLGWLTSAVSRPLMLDEHNEAVRKGHIEVDQALLTEMMTFFHINGKPEAISPNHDDCIIADAICWQMRKEQKIRGFI